LKIDIYSSHRNINISDIKNKNVVCIDVFRTTSTLIGAFNNGLKRFLVVDDPIKAPDYTDDLDNDRILMGGVDNFNFITGFDIGDSILDYSSNTVKGKELIYYNSDSSPAIKKGSRGKRMFLGGFVNMHAVAKKLVKLDDDIAIVCSGTNGNFSLEDGLAAGGIIKEIRLLKKRPDLSEYAFVMDKMYAAYHSKLLSALKKSVTYEKLISLGCENDIEYALTLNQFDIVPTYYDNWVTVK
jgi:2-phosphosulfolactate phosphatase